MAKTAILTKDGLVRYDSNIKDYIKDLTDDTIYIDPDETSTDLPDIDPVTSAKYVSYSNTNSGLEADTVQEAIDETSAIAKGKNRARVFSTTEDMNTWLSDETNKGTAIVGDNLYIVALDVPDWWISEVLEEADTETGFYYKIAQLETQKVDLTTIESDIYGIKKNLVAGHSLANHDFNDLGDEPLIGIGANMTNDPLGNTAVRYHVVHIPAYNNYETVQYAKPINYGSGTLLYFRQQKHDGTWSDWLRVVISSEITTINDSITTINNTLSQNLIFPNTTLTDIDNPPHGFSMTIIDNILYIAIMYSWIALEFQVSSSANPKVRRKYGSSGWTVWQNMTLS